MTDADAALDGGDEPPWPGPELALRVSGGAEKEAFHQSGRQSVADIERVLAVVGRDLASYRTILDFGCGCGRILIWLRDLAEKTDLHGVDIDARAVGSIQDNLPGVTATVSQIRPPLDYPDGFFDLVYNHSVFTHIDEQDQDLWLAELWRVTRPGGHVLLTVHGEQALSTFEQHSANVGGGEWVRDQVRRRGIVFIKEDSFVGGPFPDSYHSTFHAPWYVLDRWADVFTVRAYIPRGSLGFQDFVLLERGDGLPDRKPIGPLPTPVEAQVDGDADDDRPPTEGKVPSFQGVRDLIARGPDLASASEWGFATRAARSLVLRSIRHYDEHQRKVDNGLLDAFSQARAVFDHAVAEIRESMTVTEGLSLREANARLWEGLRQQGERINRLEADLWDAVRANSPENGGHGSATEADLGHEPEGREVR